MLRKIDGEDRYNCPIAMYNEWESINFLFDRVAKYEVCPLKLAGWCYFDHDQVEKGLERYFEFGRGRFLREYDKFTFSQLAHHYCDAETSTWNFTRSESMTCDFRGLG